MKKKSNMDVRARAIICFPLPYEVYHLVENYASAKDIIGTLKAAYEGNILTPIRGVMIL